MGFEDVIPPVPTREQELRFIKRMEDSFVSQPWYKLYMNEALRTRKLHDVKLMNQSKLEWFKNFCIGSVIFGVLLVIFIFQTNFICQYKPCLKYFQTERGVPHIFRYRAAPIHDGYLIDRNRKIFKAWMAFTVSGGTLYASAYQKDHYYDRNLEEKYVIVESFD